MTALGELRPDLTRDSRDSSDKSGRDWLSFKMRSRLAGPKHSPLFFDGDRINGVVYLDLVKVEKLKGLAITLVTVVRVAMLCGLLVYSTRPRRPFTPFPLPDICRFTRKIFARARRL